MTVTKEQLEFWLDGVAQDDPQNDREKILTAFARLQDDSRPLNGSVIAQYLSNLTESDREIELAVLKQQTNFCWECGSPYSAGFRTCYCMRDE